MNVKFFKLIPAEANEINPNTPCVVVWTPGHPAGPTFFTPVEKIPRFDFARHIGEGSAAIANLDRLIVDNAPVQKVETVSEELSKQWVGSA